MKHPKKTRFLLAATFSFLVAIFWLGGLKLLPGPRPVHAAPSPTPGTRPFNPASVRVLTANIRIPMSTDTGTQAWSQRRGILIRTLQAQDPDILGMQEVTPAQASYMLNNLKGLEHVPLAQDKGGFFAPLTNLAGTLNQLYYRPERWTLVASANGAVRPEAPQLQMSENTYYTLAVLEDKTKTLPLLIVLDTHLRHDIPNCIACAQRLHKIIEDQKKVYPTAQAIVMGDMNYDWKTPIGVALYGAKTPTEMTDTFNYAAKAPEEKWGTWHAFTGKVGVLWPTDLIFVTQGLKVQESAQIVRDHDNAIWPSDHFFVRATVGIAK